MAAREAESIGEGGEHRTSQWGSIGEVEERAMALEARGFSRPGRRSLLWAPSDRGWERVARWLMALSIPTLLVARAAGWLP